MSTRLSDSAALDEFIRVRRRLLTIAGQITGDPHEAEDVVQEVWLRWHRMDRTAVLNSEAVLVTMTTRLAINLVRSARRRHETSVATWLPAEVADHDADPHAQVERGERIGHAVQALLERLPSSERAAYLLREGFEYPYQQIAQALQINAANARQLVKRARAHVAAGRCRSVHPAAHHRLRRAFAAAACGGDLTTLESVLVARVE
jgi:RNA polymerase sigma factor (sigma-70 family)